MQKEIKTVGKKVKTGFKMVLFIHLFLIYFFPVFGQTDLKLLLTLAETNYPVILAKQAGAEAALVSVSLEKNRLLPSLDAAYQTNYSTYNNITGMSYPGQLLPISGPPTTENYNTAVPGSAVSILVKWEPVTFGQRNAAIEYNRKLYEKQLAGIEDEVLRLKFRVAFIYLEMAATGELIKVFQKNIDRNEFNLKQAGTLVSAGLLPAVDSLRFRGELSKARTDLFKIKNLFETQKQELLELLASNEITDIDPDDFFVQNLPAESSDSFATVENPVLKMAHLELEANQVRLQQISRSWIPKLELWGTTYARGSGISYDGTVNKSDGWSFSRYNYGVGLQLVFPILDFTNVKLKTDRQEALTSSSESYFSQMQNSLNKEETIALNDLNTSLLVAKEVPIEFEANESAFNALQTRYKSGLTDYSELIQAQYDLLNAEASLKNAFISSWKSLLKLAVIRGDVNIFINQIKN
jgi:outer membrane protein TolC